MASRKKTTQADVPQVTCWDDHDPDVQAEDARDEGFKDGLYSAGILFDEVLQAVRVDLENADLDPSANTAARMTLEMVSRLWYERKGAM